MINLHIDNIYRSKFPGIIGKKSKLLNWDTTLSVVVRREVPVGRFTGTTSSIARMLALKDQCGSASILYAISKAMSFEAFGADYIENLLYLEMTPKNHHLPVELKNEALINIRLYESCLADYDAYLVNRRKEVKNSWVKKNMGTSGAPII